MFFLIFSWFRNFKVNKFLSSFIRPSQNDLKGRTLKQATFMNATVVDLKDIETGVYILTISGSYYNEVHKVVIH